MAETFWNKKWWNHMPHVISTVVIVCTFIITVSRANDTIAENKLKLDDNIKIDSVQEKNINNNMKDVTHIKETLVRIETAQTVTQADIKTLLRETRRNNGHSTHE